jgi:hypothetical protein
VEQLIVYGDMDGRRLVRLALQTRVAAPQLPTPDGPDTPVEGPLSKIEPELAMDTEVRLKPLT